MKMAAPMLRVVRTCRKLNYRHLRAFYRTLLSDEYRCDDEWKYRLNSKFLTEMEPRQFGYDLLKRFDKEKYISPLDMELFANNIQKLGEADDEMIEDIIFKYRHVDDSVPINNVMPHTLVRAYIERDRVDRLLLMMKDKVKYGIFPDFQAFCLLLDHLIENEKYEDAASVAAEVMLQEDFSHQLCNLLCVYALTKCYKHSQLGELLTRDSTSKETDQTQEVEEEMTYIPVKIIWNPYYDDHFDIKEERLLLGKSLYCFGKNTHDIQDVDARSLQLIGLGLYEKFDLGIRLLEHWIEEVVDPEIVHEEARQSFFESLQNAPVRDETAEPVPMGQKTLDDCVVELWFTQSEKSACIEKYQKFHDMLPKRGLSKEDLEQSISRTVKTNVIEFEPEDMRIMKDNYHDWMMQRQKLLPSYMLEHKKWAKMAEIRQKLLLIHEKEELLSFFKKKDVILSQIKVQKQLKEGKVEVDHEAEQYVEAPGERNVKKTIKR